MRKYAEATSKIRSSKSSVNEYMLYAVRDLDGKVTCKDILAVPPAYGNTSYTSASKYFTASGTKIYPYAFYENTFITYMTIGQSVREVGEYAFASSSITGCRDNSTAEGETWGQSTFADSNLKNISWAATGEACPLKEIPAFCFSECSSNAFKTISLPKSITKINKCAFQNTNIKTITFGESDSYSDNLTTIGERAFYNCASLTSFSVTSSLTSLGERAFQKCVNLTDFNFINPSSDDYRLNNISTQCFEECYYLQTIDIPKSVVEIDVQAFRWCSSLKSVNFYGKNLSVIGSSAFFLCQSLTNVSFPSSLERIDDKAFCKCYKLGNINFASNTNLYKIGPFAFNNCSSGSSNYLNLTTGLPPNLDKLGDYAFAFSKLHCSSKIIVIPSTLLDMGINPFADNVDIYYFYSNSVDFKSKGNALYNDDYSRLICYPSAAGQNLNNERRGYIIDPNVKSIDPYAFMNNTDIVHVVLPSSITTIPSGLFVNCTSLSSITIPAKISKIDVAAFYGCTNLKEVFMMPTTPPEFLPTSIAVLYDEKGDYSTHKQFERVTDCTLYTKINTTSTSTLDSYKADENYKSVFKEITPYIPITVGSTGYLTLARDFDVYLSSDHPDTKYGLLPYAVKSFNASKATVTLKQVKPNQNSTGWTADNLYVPSRMESDGLDQVYNGVLLKGEPGFTYYVRMGTGDYNTT